MGELGKLCLNQKIGQLFVCGELEKGRPSALEAELHNDDMPFTAILIGSFSDRLLEEGIEAEDLALRTSVGRLQHKVQ